MSQSIDNIKESVSIYYGQTIQKTDDFEFNACCVADYDNILLEKITAEVLEKRYGCGSPLPELIEGKTVLDLGSGAGIDCFIAAQLVGEEGHVIGIDMTDAQLEIANRNIAPHMKNFGYTKTNVEFKKGYIEDIPMEDNSVDIVLSNCVINLSPNKDKVFKEIYRILKPGGEFYISDIVCDRRVPQRLQDNEILWGECLTGAAYIGDLRRIMEGAGFFDTRVVSQRFTDLVEGLRFYSRNIRGYKIDLEDQCEDYGQVAVYQGTIVGHEDKFFLDKNHTFHAGVAQRVCKNTSDILTKSRFAPHFQVSAPLSHLGIFDCSSDAPSSIETPIVSSCC